MLSKNELKYIQSLCHKKFREQEKSFIVEGVKLVDELLLSNYTIKKIYAIKKWVQEHASVNASIVEIEEFELNKISSLQTPNQVLAIAEQPKNVGLPIFKNHFILALDDIQDPGNLGTIIRIADWFGIHQIICSNNTVELYNSKVIQSSMGSFLRVNVWYDDLLNCLRNCQTPVFGAVLNGKNITQFKQQKEGVLIIGNESKGISDAIKQVIQHPVTIPKKGGAESLNAAVATGILLSHLI